MFGYWVTIRPKLGLLIAPLNAFAVSLRQIAYVN